MMFLFTEKEPKTSTGESPPPTKKRKTIKNSILNLWKEKLPGYHMYYRFFPPQLSDIDKKIELISEYLLRKRYIIPDRLMEIEKTLFFEVVCEHVFIVTKFMTGWPNFRGELCSDPVQVHALWGAVMHKVHFYIFL
jgi:hypothetical protein